MIENIIQYLKISLETNISIVIILLIVFIIYQLFISKKEIPKIGFLLEGNTRNYKRVYSETRLFIFINNQKYYMKNVEDINKINKILNTKNIIVDNENKEFYFIEK